MNHKTERERELTLPCWLGISAVFSLENVIFDFKFTPATASTLSRMHWVTKGFPEGVQWEQMFPALP